MQLILLIVMLGTLPVSTSPGAQVARQEVPIRIGSTDLRIGMPRDKVLSLLKTDGFDQLSLSTEQKDSIELISVVRYPNNALLRAVANVYFENKKLIRVERLLSFRTEAEVMDTIYGLVAKFQQEGNSVCSLAARSIENGDQTHKTATFACGHKFIEISILQGSGGEALVLGISEGLNESVLP